MMPGKFIGELFASRDAMHLQHLATESYAEHKALDGYYSGILDLIDSFTEKYFGQKGRCEIVIPSSKKEKPAEHLKGIQQLMTKERELYSSDLQNIIDEMLGLVNETLYLLTLV